MRRNYPFGLALLLAPIAAAATCEPGTLADYIALGSQGCAIVSARVFDFRYTAGATGGATEIPPRAIKVTPMFMVPATQGVEFAADWKVASAQRQWSWIRFRLETSAPDSQVKQLNLTGTGFQGGQFSTAVVHERTSAGDLAVFLQCVEVCRAVNSATLTIQPSTVLDIAATVLLESRMGNAALAGFTAEFSECPLCVAYEEK